MGRLTPTGFTPFDWRVAAQEESAGGANETATQETVEQPVGEPLVTGAAPALWTTFGAFILIFIVVLVAIIRSRVVKPAERMARRKEIFEPAGADAEITFDEPEAAQKEETRKDKKRRRKTEKQTDQESETETEAAVPTDTDDFDDLKFEEANEPFIDDSVIVEPAETPTKSRAPFAGLFSRRKDEPAEEEAPAPVDAVEAPAEDSPFAEVSIERQEPDQDVVADDMRAPHEDPAAAAEHARLEAERARREAEAAEERQRAELARAEEERRLAIEEVARARVQAKENRQRLAAAQEESAREAAIERRIAEAELDERMQALSTIQRRLRENAELLSSDMEAAQMRMGRAFDEKLSRLSDDIHKELGAVAAEIGRFAADLRQSESAPADASGATALEIAALRDLMEQALARLEERVDRLDASAAAPVDRKELQSLNKLLSERAAPAVAGALQLNTLVRSALPADQYAFDVPLKTGAKAECLISMPGARRPFAIDARFPVEAYNAYARAAGGESDPATAYRRAVLRHMIFLAEKIVSPEETADFAILFTPNDIIFNDLHSNFPDLIQDSYRARIWPASPTSLMATLHMMSAAATHATNEGRASIDENLYAELKHLNARMAQLERALAADAEREDAPVAEDASETQPEFPAFEDADEEAPSGNGDEASDPQPAQRSSNIVRPPFPLR